MSHHRMSRRTKRNSIVAGAVAAVLIPLGVAGTAMAGDDSSGSSQPATKQAAESKPGSDRSAASEDTPAVVTEVEKFYQGYISALGEGDDEQAKSLRKAALTESLQNDLAEWEQQNAADGVLRTQNVPVEAEAVYDGSGTGHSWTIVTLKWDRGPEPTKLHVQSDLETHKISGIKPLD